MPRLKNISTEDIIGMVAKIRIKNNELWMEILRIAVNEHPIATRMILKNIRLNDKEITKWLGKL